ncbi:MAG TPA: histidine--tRNA ligase [Planctomycetes bacterium]|nr:histidine--tRNA ligase [Planctomycetota bacterium]
MKVQSLKGFRDYLPEEMLQKDRMLDSVRQVFERHGYPPLMTPALEYSDVLLGKYGDDGEMLLYRFRDHGDRDVAMRFDLTVPLARVLAEHGEITFPFRRYQIAPVWRAEKPARGRFREFVQCDVDLVGVDSAAADAEMLVVGTAVMDQLGIEGYQIRVNHRGILAALCRLVGLTQTGEVAFLRLLDKLDKIGADKFRSQVGEIPGIDPAGVDRVLGTVLEAPEDSRQVLEHLSTTIGNDSVAAEAIARMEAVQVLLEASGIAASCRIDPSIARGLSYYTGLVYETYLDALPGFGSVMSGGRYDGLLGMFLGKDVPAIGISLGIDRLFAALKELDLLDPRTQPADVMVAQFSEELAGASFGAAAQLRRAGIHTLVYPREVKLKKQLQYAQKAGIPFVIVIGGDEQKAGTVQFRSMEQGQQEELSLTEAIEKIAQTRCRDAK